MVSPAFAASGRITAKSASCSLFSCTKSSGAPLDFVQENKEQDADFAVILPEAAKAGDTIRLLTQYAGTDALLSEGNDTYYLLSAARDSWYPSGQGQIGDFANFHMTFHVPKGLEVVATGKQTSATPESGG